MVCSQNITNNTTFSFQQICSLSPLVFHNLHSNLSNASQNVAYFTEFVKVNTEQR